MEKFYVNNINSEIVKARISKFAPRLVVVLGTSIIKKNTVQTIKDASSYFVNIHLGITPEYRGVKPEFWCILNKEPNMVGTTIHHLEAGIDTGKIIMQEKLAVEDLDRSYAFDYRYLRYKNTLLAANMLKRFLNFAAAGNFPVFEKASTQSRLYSTPRWRDYRLYYKNL